MNPSRRRGTAGENYWLSKLRALFHPGVSDGGVTDTEHPLQRLDNTARHKRAVDGDFTGVPWPHEAKTTTKPLFLQWARHLRKKAGENWVLLWSGDKRTAEGKPLVLMPWEKYEQLVRASQQVEN